MTNPFHHTREDGSEYRASLPELKAMVPGLADAELNALCAAVCDEEFVEEFVEWLDDGVNPPGFRARIRLRDPIPYYGPIARYTSDWREAGRLLEKYHPSVLHHLLRRFPWERGSLTEEFRRDITEAAVVAGLTEMIEGGGE
ncbi:hypothetical protein LCGC14_0811490 [marine sediment metagenome]|uniref:Uncharacterized protein n=1 Tax=marine sediment metagenome TaxID=412755 RepID=A0A0F9SU02_9ZZZZ